MILIISSERDSHTMTVLDSLARAGAKAKLLDLSSFPARMQLSVSYRDGNLPDYRIRDADTAEVALADCGVIWWRRPQSFTVHPEITDPAYHDFALSEAQEAFT